MKIESRVAGAPRYVASSTRATATTLPSAGAITNRSPRGPDRTGSRKNTISHRARSSSTTSSAHSHRPPPHVPTPHAPIATRAHPGRMKGQPSGAIRISVHRLKPVLGPALPLRAVPRRAHPSGWEQIVRSRSHLQRLPRQAAVRIQVALARGAHHLGRERRRRRVPVPPLLLLQVGQIVAQRLLVEARLALAGPVAVGGPEAGRVGGEDLVDHEQLARRGGTELEFGVGDDDAVRSRIAAPRLVQGQAPPRACPAPGTRPRPSPRCSPA